MLRLIAALAVSIALAGCSTDFDGEGPSTSEVVDACAEQGSGSGTDAYADCVGQGARAQCKDVATYGTPRYEQCVERVMGGAFEDE